MADVVNALVYLLDHLTTDEKAAKVRHIVDCDIILTRASVIGQSVFHSFWCPIHVLRQYGFTFICDMRKWGWSNFGTSYASQV